MRACHSAGAIRSCETAAAILPAALACVFIGASSNLRGDYHSGGAWPDRGAGIEKARMSKTIQIRMAGYGPPTTGFSKALKFIGDKLQAEFGPRVAIEYVWNIMDHGYKAEDILTLVENGEMTLGYQSSSYLTGRVPELGFVDLPFLFANNAQARAAMDGAPGPVRRSRPFSCRQSRGTHRLSSPRLVRDRLSPHLHPAAAGASPRRS